MSDAGLVAACAAGDRAARGSCSSATSTRCIASSRACAAAMPTRSTISCTRRSRARSRGGSLSRRNVRGWLYGIAANLSSEHARKRDPAQAHARAVAELRSRDRTSPTRICSRTCRRALAALPHDLARRVRARSISKASAAATPRRARHPRGHAVAARLRRAPAPSQACGRRVVTCPALGQLAAAASASTIVIAHATDCARCGRLLAEQQELLAAARRMRIPQLGADRRQLLAAEVMAATDVAFEPRWRGGRVMIAASAPVAAALRVPRCNEPDAIAAGTRRGNRAECGGGRGRP